MKKIISTLLLVSSVAFAGGSVGTMGSASKMYGQSISDNSRPPEIVYHMGEQDGIVRFAYGSLVNNQWQVQKISGRLDYLTKKTDLITSLHESKNTHQWVQVK